MTHDISDYDANYAALSFRFSLPLIHADRKLRNSLQGRLPLEIWLEEYPRIRRRGWS